MTEKTKLVLPGDFLTTEEEFFAGKNTFENGSGKIYSTSIGLAEFKEKERKVEVKQKKSLNLLDAGSVITGQVILVKDSRLVISILKAEKNGEKKIPLNSSAVLLISNVSQGFVKNLRDEFRVGDIIKAKVISVSPQSIEVTTSYSDLGVIKAYCVKCRNALELSGRELKCRNCGSVEGRKISSDYGKN